MPSRKRDSRRKDKSANKRQSRAANSLGYDTLEPRAMLSATLGDSVVTFNELLYNPAPNYTGGEWIELHNQLSVDVDLSNWSLSGGIEYSFAPGTTIESGEYLVIAKDAAALEAAEGITGVLGGFSGSLSNGGETIHLLDHNDRIMDELIYDDEGDWPVAADGSGATLAKTSQHLATGDFDAWHFSATSGGTPGSQNTISGSDLRLSELAGATDADFRVELENTGSSSLNLSGYSLVWDGDNTATYALSGSVAAGGFVSFDQATTGFDPADGDKIFLTGPGNTVADGAEVKQTARARSAQWDGRFQRPDTATFGSANSFDFQDAIVINEILYHQTPDGGIGSNTGTPFTEDPEEWIELYNRSDNAVDLSGFEFEDGVSFTFAPGTTLEAGEYLVVASDAVALAAKYPGINIAGEFDGGLSNSGERIQLVDSIGNLADEVIYFDGGAFDERADGGGSSLELRDPDADNSNGQAWSASDSGDDAQWQTVTYTGQTTPHDGTAQIWNEFIFGLLDDGEILIDDISVIYDPGGANVELIQNGSFNNGLATWRAGGNHRYATIVADPDDANNQVLQLRTTGSAEHIYNHVETTFVNNTAILIGETYQISYRAKSISGSNQLNTRLYFNQLPHTERLARPKTTGTPGTVNSSAESNIGPTFQNLQQSVVTPSVGQSVQISVDAEDPDGVANVVLWYSANEGPWQQTSTTVSDGRYTGTIPGFGDETVVQFYVEGTDGSGESSTFPAAGRDSRALYKVNTSAGNASNGSNSLQIVLLPSESSFLRDVTNLFSNDQLGATVIDETGTIYYDVGTRFKGSLVGRSNDSTRGFWIGFNPDQQYRGVHDTVTINTDGQKEIFAKHLLQAAGEGVPGFYDDIVNLESPTGAISGIGILNLARYGDIYLDSQFEDGSDGNVFNLELLYKPTSTIGGVEDLKRLTRPQLTTADGQPDFTSYGSDAEAYRYNFQLENNRAEDDFSGLIEFLGTFDLDGDALYEKAIEVLDLDQFVRTFTANSIVGTNDTYSRQANPNNPTSHNEHNLRLFENPEDGKFLALPWDLDRSFQLGVNDTLAGTFGTLAKLFALPQVERLFYGHAEDIITNVYTSSYVTTWGIHYGDLVNDFGDFNTERNYIFNRSQHILNNELPQSFEIPDFEITTNGGNDFSVGSNQVILQGTGSYQIRELLIDGFADPLEVTWLDDITWQVEISVNPGTNNLTFRALDFSGNEIHSDSITVTSTDNSALAQDHLRVTEINYHPADPTSAEQLAIPGVGDNDFEFIELVNTSTTQSLNLSGVQFVEQVLNNDNQGITFTFSDLTLAPGERVVVVQNLDAFELRYGTTANVAGEYSGKLSNGGETITLRDATGQTIQQFAYDDAAPWPTSTDGGGSSLTVVDTAGDYNSSSNWTAATPSPGFLEQEFLLGDANQDGIVDFNDISAFIGLLQGGPFLAEADINGDGIIDFKDIAPFINLLANGSPDLDE